jgi:cell division protein ZapA
MEERLHTVKVTIFGSEYVIKGEADPVYVSKLAKYVDSKMLELTGGSTSAATVRLAVLAAFNIADELFQVREQLEKLGSVKGSDELEKRLANLARMLDQALATPE